MMPEGVQRYMAALGETGCLLLSLGHFSELVTGREVDPVALYRHELWTRLILADCTVEDVAAVATDQTGMKWICLRAGDGKDDNGVAYDLPMSYVLAPGEHEIGKWKRALNAAQTVTHFAYRAPQPQWDPYGGAETIRSGSLVARYILRRA